MKANRTINQEAKTKKTLLRRKTMKATRLIMIGMAAAAVIFSGCSRDNRITAPGAEATPDIDKNQDELSIKAETASNATRVAIRDSEAQTERFSIVAEVMRTEVEGGCWYLSSEDGDNFTPITPKSLSLELGMILKAQGYIDKDIQFFCGNGPAFVIEEYEILSKWRAPALDRAHKSASDEQAADASAGAPAGISKNATAEISQDNSASALGKEKASEIEKKKANTDAQTPVDDRAPSKSTSGNAPAMLTEDRASQNSALTKSVKESKPENISKLPAEDRAPQNSAYIKNVKESKSENISKLPADDRAPAQGGNGSLDAATASFEKEKASGEFNNGYIQYVPADVHSFQKLEKRKKAAPAEVLSAKPVPIIPEGTELRAVDGVSWLEGYTHHAKGGCLLLTTDDKEVFELQHDMDQDVLIQDGSYIRVTGYVSTLPYFTCEEATVFHAETINIMWVPKETDKPKNDEYKATNEADDSDQAYDVEYIEEEGVMHPTEPEGMCWYLETAGGDKYELLFSSPVGLRSGMHLKVKGLVAEVSTFCEAGKPLQVAHWETVNEDKF